MLPSYRQSAAVLRQSAAVLKAECCRPRRGPARRRSLVDRDLRPVQRRVHHAGRDRVRRDAEAAQACKSGKDSDIAMGHSQRYLTNFEYIAES